MAKPLKAIEAVLKEQEEKKWIDKERAGSLLELAAKRLDITFDTDTIDKPSNQRYVLSHNKFEEATREDLQSTLAKMEAEMQSLFCEASKENKSYLDFEPPRPVPTQFLAFQQLQYRFEDKSSPFLVCCVALPL